MTEYFVDLNDVDGTSSNTGTQSYKKSASMCSLQSLEIGQDHNKEYALIRGRESHTSDLHTFDRLVLLMKQKRERMEDLHTTNCCDDDYDSFRFNDQFWSYLRDILKKAKPVGFEDANDEHTVIPKGPDDADAFLQKVIAISPINPIVPKVIAEGSDGQFTEDEVITELLFGVHSSLLRLQFAPECDRCGSPFSARDQLEDIPPTAVCDGCHFHNRIDSIDRIEVVFFFNPEILYILADNFACTPSSKSMNSTHVFAAVPATYSGSGFRYSVGGFDGTHKELGPALKAGKYRMHCPVARTDNYLIVRRDAEETDDHHRVELKVSSITCKRVNNDHDGYKENLRTISVPHGKIHFDIFCDTKSFFVLWILDDADEDSLLRLPKDERAPYTSVATVIHNKVFNRFFSNQVVSSNPDSALGIQNVLLVFTDVVKSTEMYATMGDGPALQLIRKHFNVLFKAFTKRGRIVKTMGDSVMASFTSGRAAIEAVAEALRRVTETVLYPNGEPLQIRVGIHRGAALVIPVNGNNDFFGQTVNIAARVEAAAKACECLITEDVLSFGPDSKDAFTEIVDYQCGEGDFLFKQTERTELSLKGVTNPVHARGFRLQKRSRLKSLQSESFGSESIRVLGRSSRFDRRPSYKSFDSDLSSLHDFSMYPDHNVTHSSVESTNIMYTSNWTKLGRRNSTLIDVDEIDSGSHNENSINENKVIGK